MSGKYLGKHAWDMMSVGAKTLEQKEQRERRAKGKYLFLFLNGPGEESEEGKKCRARGSRN